MREVGPPSLPLWEGEDVTSMTQSLMIHCQHLTNKSKIKYVSSQACRLILGSVPHGSSRRMPSHKINQFQIIL
jgi:hypothetical protein